MKKIFSDICKNGDIKALKKIIKEYSNSESDKWERYLLEAYVGGNFEIVKIMYEFIPQKLIDGWNFSWNDIIYSVCKGGNMNIINLIISNMEKRGKEIFWNYGLEGACEGNHMDIVEFVISKGADKWRMGIEGASKGNNMDMFKYMLKKINENETSKGHHTFYSSVLLNICKNENMEMMNIIIPEIEKIQIPSELPILKDQIISSENGFVPLNNITYTTITDTSETWNFGLYGACESGNMNIVKFMIEKGAYDWNSGLLSACKHGHVKVTNLMISLGADELTYGLDKACKGGHIDIVKLLILKLKEDVNFFPYMMDACTSCHLDIAELLIPLVNPKYYCFECIFEYKVTHFLNKKLDKKIFKGSCRKQVKDRDIKIKSINDILESYLIRDLTQLLDQYVGYD